MIFIDDPNFKICVTSTNILLKVCSSTDIKRHFEKIVEKVFHKLGDGKMAMRSQSQRIIKNLYEVLILKFRLNAKSRKLFG